MKSQRGIAVAAVIYVLLALGVITSVSILWYKYNSAIEGKVKAEQYAKSLEATIQNKEDQIVQLGNEKKALNTQLLKRQVRQNVIIQTQQAEIAAALPSQAIADKDEILWRLSPIPESLLIRLRNTDTSSNGNTDSGNSTSVANTTEAKDLDGVEPKDK